MGIGIMTDEGLVPDPKALSEAVNAEFRELQVAFESGSDAERGAGSIAA